MVLWFYGSQFNGSEMLAKVDAYLQMMCSEDPVWGASMGQEREHV